MPSFDRYKYTIVFASFGILLCSPATGYANGVFFVNFKESRSYDAAVLAWVMSTTQFMHAIGGLIGSLLISVSSPRRVVVVGGVLSLAGFSIGTLSTDIRVLILSHGVILGTGRGFAFAGVNVIIGYWFRENSALASGITFSSIGIGMLVHPGLTQALTDWYGVDGAQLLMGAITFQTCVFGMLYRPSEFEKQRRHETKHLQRQRSRKKRLFKACYILKKSVFKNPSFLCFAFAFCCFDTALQCLLTFLPDFYTFHGSTRQEAALAVSVSGISGIFSRILAGIMTNDPKIGKVLLFSGNCGLMAMITISLPWLVMSHIGRSLYSFLQGVYVSPSIVVLGPTTLQKVGLEHFTHGLGFILFLLGLDALLAPPIAVQIREYSGSYYAVFIFAASCLISASCLGLLSEAFPPNQSHEQCQETETCLVVKAEHSSNKLDSESSSKHSQRYGKPTDEYKFGNCEEKLHLNVRQENDEGLVISTPEEDLDTEATKTNRRGEDFGSEKNVPDDRSSETASLPEHSFESNNNSVMDMPEVT